MSWFNLRASVPGRIVVDIGSASISANIVVDNRVKFSTSREIQYSDKLDFQEFLTKITRTLEEVVAEIHANPLGSGIRSFHLFLPSPFYLATAQTSEHSGPKDFTVNYRLLGNLMKTKVTEVINQQKASYGDESNGDWQILEEKIVAVRLKGYEVTNYLNKQTDNLEIDWFFTIVSGKIIQRLKETIQKVVWTEDIRFHSFLFAAFESLRDLGVGKNFLLVDVSGELTDVALVTEGTIREHMSFPIGRNSIIKKFGQKTQTGNAQLISQLRALTAGHLDKHVARDISQKIKSEGEEWLEQFRLVLLAISEKAYVPSSIFLVGEDETTELFAGWLEEKNFSDSTYTHQPFQITVIDSESLHQTLEWTEKVSHNSFLILETIYCDRIEDSSR